MHLVSGMHNNSVAPLHGDDNIDMQASVTLIESVASWQAELLKRLAQMH